MKQIASSPYSKKLRLDSAKVQKNESQVKTGKVLAVSGDGQLRKRPQSAYIAGRGGGAKAFSSFSEMTFNLDS